MALKALCQNVFGKHIRIRSDNTSVVSCLNKFGTCHSSTLHSFSREIWLWCINRDIWLTAQHIPGKQNVMADSYSRRFNTNTEWMLDGSVFNSLTISFFSPDVDLFASRLNKRMTPFVSWLPDPDALATDAFCLDWGRFRRYIFPPFCLINRILQKLSQDGAEAILVVPLWKTQTWYPKMLNMLVDFPLILPTTNDILSLPSSDREHPLSHNMTLLACHLSGNDCKTEEFRSKLPTSSPSHGGCLRERVTTRPLRNGSFSVLQGKLIQFSRM